ncbi:MAG: heat-inducible transcriptional repressor HrcA [Stappiaceae bacterium]
MNLGSMPASLTDLDKRSRSIFRSIVESYLDTGEPVGSRNISRLLPMTLSPASVRNVMADLEHLGLVYSPHTSAGRMPTELGLRFFVDALLEVGDLTKEEREQIAVQVKAGSQKSYEQVLTEASQMLSGLSRGAGVVLTHKTDSPLKHLEFVQLEPQKALVVMVTDDGTVENRVIDLPHGLPQSALVEASNYLNAHIRGKTLAEAKEALTLVMGEEKAVLDALTRKVIDAGLAIQVGDESSDQPTLIVRGRSNLLDDLKAVEDLERIRLLFDDLENKRELIRLLGLAEEGEGVRIFIGSENNLFSLSGSSLIVSPYRDSEQNIVGVLGVIGPTRLNYARVIPMVDYTAQLVSRLMR